MTVNKRKKNSRQHGTKTHGWGSMKKHRGAGNRGGRGHSGSGKRADQKKTMFWKERYFGKLGFASKSRAVKIKDTNIKTIEDRLENLVKSGIAKYENNTYTINLADIGYNKLLSTGNPTKKLLLTVLYSTEKAIEKIEKAGGSVKVLGKKKEKKKKAKAENEEANA